MINATDATFLNFIVRALRASGVAGMWAVVFALISYPVLFIAILGLVPLFAEIADFSGKLLGIPSGGSAFSIVVFWSIVVYLAVFANRLSIKPALEKDRATLLAHLGLGVLAMLVFCASIVHLAHERRTETRARETKVLVLDFVERNDAVMREVGGYGKVWLSSGAYDRDGSGWYDVNVTGAKTIYAIVAASKDAP